MIQYFSKDVISNNLKLHTEVFGNPSDLACILIAGKMSTARFWTNAFCQYLAEQGLFTIRYDHRDMGESSEIDWQSSPYSMADLTKDVTLIMDNHGIKKAHFVGFSMGGEICQWLGVNYSERIISLNIISAEPIETTEQVIIPLTAKEQEILNNTLNIFLSVEEGDTLEESIQNYLPLWRYLNAEMPLDEEMTKDFTIDLLKRTKNKNAKNHELVRQEFLSQRKCLNFLQKINCPTLVIHGDKDPVVLPKYGKSIADAILKSELVMIKGMGHAFFNRTLEATIANLVVDHCKK